jgi:signal transduction histidine kinase
MKLTIYQKLLMFTLPIVCFSILGVGYYSFWVAKKEMMNEIRLTVLRQAGDTAAELGRLSRRAGIDLITLSEITYIRDYGNNVDYELYNEAEVCRTSIETFMLNLLERSKVYSGATYIDGKGMEVAKVIKNEVRSKRRNLKEEVFFKEARGLVHGGIHVSPLGVGEGDEGVILRYATPIFNEIGKFDGVMTLDLNFDGVQDVVRNAKIGSTGHAFLIDQGGNLLSDPQKGQIFKPIDDPEMKMVIGEMKQGGQGWGIYATSNGDHLIGYAPVESLKWSIAITAPLSDFMGRINQIKVNSTLVMFVSMGIATFGILIIARSLSHPIKELVGYTRAVSNGNFDHQMTVSSKDEIGELARSFNEMTRRIKSSQEEIEAWNRGLEERVRITSGELRAEKEKLEGTFVSMNDAVIVLDKFSKVIDLNPAAERLLGAHRPDLIGYQILVDPKKFEAENPAVRNLHTICTPKNPGKDFFKCWEYFDCKKNDCPAFRSEEWRCWLLQGTTCDHSSPVAVKGKSGVKDCSSCPLFIRIKEKYIPIKQTEMEEIELDTPPSTIRVFRTPMFSSGGGYSGMVFVLHDVTKDKEIDKMKSDFVSNVSHELRTPLTSIKSFSELILDDLDAMDIEIQKRFLGIIRDEAERLTRLISDILDLQKIQTNNIKWHVENVELSQVIENSMLTFSELAKTKRLHLSCETQGDLPLVYGDRDRLQQVLINLISNAIKFSKENGQIKMQAKEIPEGVLLSVSDNGIGIPVDKRERVFERFYQVDGSATKERGGTGLGLAISKEIIEHHGGRIWVESKVGEGCTFSFVIPRGIRG